MAACASTPASRPGQRAPPTCAFFLAAACCSRYSSLLTRRPSLSRNTCTGRRVPGVEQRLQLGGAAAHSRQGSPQHKQPRANVQLPLASGHCTPNMDPCSTAGSQQQQRATCHARRLATHRLCAAARHIRLQIRKALALALTLGRHLSHQLAACGQEEWQSAVQRRQGAGRQTALGQGMQAAAAWVGGQDRPPRTMN